MGKWAKTLFGRESFGDVGVIVGGNTPHDDDFLRHRVDFVLESNRDGFAYHTHLVETSSGIYPVVFNVYGAPAVIDVLACMQNGGCRNVLFVGYAFGFKGLKVGDLVFPQRAYHFDTPHQEFISKDVKISSPDNSLMRKLMGVLDEADIPYSSGDHISVPSVIHQPRHSNQVYTEIQPLTLEMEVASLYSSSREMGVRATALVVVSDTRTANLGSESNKSLRAEVKEGVMDLIFSDLSRFSLPRLESDFSMDSCLASIVEMPGREGNAYSE